MVKDTDPSRWKKEQDKAEQDKMTIANQHTNISLWQYDLILVNIESHVHPGLQWQ